MKKICCACGKLIRMSVLMGNEGHELSGKAYACYECSKKIGYGKGLLGTMSLALMTREQFIQEYNAVIEKENIKKQEELEIKKRIKEERQAKIDFAKNVVAKLTNKQVETKADKKNEDEFQVENGAVDIASLTDEELIDKMDSYIVEHPGVMLLQDEKCFYQGPCYSVRLKNVVTGISGSSVHIGGKSTLGMRISSGSSHRSYDRSTVAEKYPGNFYITNTRMICSALKLSFEIKLTNITSLTFYSDSLIITSKDKTYIVETEDVATIKEMLNVNNEGIRRGLPGKNQESSAMGRIEKDKNQVIGEEKIVHLLREYKTLLDDGIITEEEFLNKKNELLKK